MAWFEVLCWQMKQGYKLSETLALIMYYFVITKEEDNCFNAVYNPVMIL